MLQSDGVLQVVMKDSGGTIYLDHLSDDFQAYDSHGDPVASVPPLGKWKGPFVFDSEVVYVSESRPDPISTADAFTGWCLIDIGTGSFTLFSPDFATATVGSIDRTEFSNESASSPQPMSIVGQAFFVRMATKTFTTMDDLAGKAALTDLPYNYYTQPVTTSITIADGAVSRISTSGYTYLTNNPTILLPIPASGKIAECVLRWNTGSTVHAPTLALPSGKTAQSFSISGDTPEANAKYEMFVQIVPTTTANTYEVISVTRKLA